MRSDSVDYCSAASRKFGKGKVSLFTCCRVGLAAFEEYEAAVAVVGSEDRFEIEGVALTGSPNVGRHDDEAGGRVAETPLQHGCVAIEIKEQRRDFFLKSVEIKGVGGHNDAGDFFGGRPK